jgi:4-hydroxybenzoate polyprenyltransferase
MGDRERDRAHPEKKDRPIASGQLGLTPAVASLAVLFAAALFGAWIIRPLVAVIVGGYVALNLAYSYGLKNLVILDAFSIAFGFVLRMLAGAEALRAVEAKTEISTWIILCTLLGSFFLAFCKRRQELSLDEAAANHRASLEHYSTRFLDQMIAISCAATVMAYALWTMWPETVSKYGTRALFWTVPFVCYGIFRYLYLVHQKNEGGSPSKVFLTDRPLQVNIFLWFLAVVSILYFGL